MFKGTLRASGPTHTFHRWGNWEPEAKAWLLRGWLVTTVWFSGPYFMPSLLHLQRAVEEMSRCYLYPAQVTWFLCSSPTQSNSSIPFSVWSTSPLRTTTPVLSRGLRCGPIYQFQHMSSQHLAHIFVQSPCILLAHGMSMSPGELVTSVQLCTWDPAWQQMAAHTTFLACPSCISPSPITQEALCVEFNCQYYLLFKFVSCSYCNIINSAFVACSYILKSHRKPKLLCFL